MLKSKNGITLISLVVTIVVLLILAGVAISIAVDSDGLFKKAGEAGESWNTAVEEEQTEIGVLIDNLEKISPTADISGANGPKTPLGVTVKYVTWVEDEEVEGKYNEVLSDTKPENWHNYNEKQWANIKTTSKTANSDGTYNEAYWVWIPRYAYQVPEKPTEENSTGNAPEFKIVFLEGTTNNPVDSTILNGKTIKPNTLESVAVGDWVVHPAFKFGDKQLTGIWVAKFEASSNAPNTVANGGGDTTEYQVQVKPSVPSWRYITVSNTFDVCQNMTESTGALEGATTTDPHMMKNVEWGAVAYLSQSKYGKMGQVWNNPYGADINTAWNDENEEVEGNRVILTGKAAQTAGADAANTTECDSYNEGNGPEASTTGTVYGVYDMAGGSNEMTAAYLNSDEASNSSNIASLYKAELKYKDVYEWSKGLDQPLIYNMNANKYGDAIYEISYAGIGGTAWNSDQSNMPARAFFCFARGGLSLNSNASSGVFAFTNGTR